MKVFLRSFAITSSLVMAAIMAASPSRADQVLNFSVYVSDKPITVVRQFRPVLKALETALADRLGEKVTINIQVARTYEEGLKNLVDGKVDFARFGPASYILAKQANPGLSLLAMESVKGEKTFKMNFRISRPSISGRWRSRTIPSGELFRMVSRASLPVPT